jgi:hypothetical protein
MDILAILEHFALVLFQLNEIDTSTLLCTITIGLSHHRPFPMAYRLNNCLPTLVALLDAALHPFAVNTEPDTFGLSQDNSIIGE